MSTVDDTVRLQNKMIQDDQDTVEQQKQRYENMSYDEMAQHMENNYKELSGILGSGGQPLLRSSSIASLDEDDDQGTTTGTSASSMSLSSSSETTFDDERIVDQAHVDDSTKRIKMNKLFSRAASSGDLDRLAMFLAPNDKYRHYIDINVKDEDGTTPLIYASCFGKLDVVQTLLDADADTNIQDSFGWSALMWATNNSHEPIVKLLLEHGASSNTKSAKGRTVMDFVNTEKNQKMAELILNNPNTTSNPRDSLSSTTSSIAMGRIRSSTSSYSMLENDQDFYYHSTMDGYDAFMAEEAERRQKLLDSLALMGIDDDDFDDDDMYDDDNNSTNGLTNYDEEDDNDDDIAFCWDKCLPDQMFVFNQEKLPALLDTIINHAQAALATSTDEVDETAAVGENNDLPNKEMDHSVAVWTPANIIFLLARFAHYFCTSEVLDEVLQQSLDRINHLVTTHSNDINVLTYWMTNYTQLLYYLKKDHGLVGATAEYQLQLSEYISETYTLMIHDVQHQLSKLLEPGMLGYGVIPGMEDVHFTDDWQRFFRRGNNIQQPTTSSTSSTSVLGIAATPRAVIAVLSSALDVMQQNKVQPTILIQALAQFLHYISCDLFNHVLKTKKLMCRSKALQIRMNLSYVEDWVRHHGLPTRLLSYLAPTIQLLQLLQCLSQLQDVPSLMDTLAACDALNALQVKRCIVKYRYEVGERRISDDIEQYVVQLAGDMVKYRQARQSSSIDLPRPQQLTKLVAEAAQEQPTTDAGSTTMTRSSSDFTATKPSHGGGGGTALRRSQSTSRPESMYQVLGNFMSGTGLVSSQSEPPVSSSSSSIQQEQETSDLQQDATVTNDDILDNSVTAEDEEVNDMYETKDTKFLLPFKVPPMAHMNNAYNANHALFSGGVPPLSFGSDDQEESPSTIQQPPTTTMVPTIPDTWMDLLDGAH
ncbi:hypothetical protein BCR42DRAFT_370456 [Absidia repens]|uniref:Dilute domain-containing protein n=1 Tax=Absidia repens TaxID=90262 RepID=A0A1X2IQU0_9FUNG|nr:hypothetical protein BCR42DRAFT_370456 [Absidia repens]